MTGWETVAAMGQHFHLNLGDFMYADHPMWFGEEKAAFEVHYRDIFHDTSYSAFSRTVPAFFIYDDHEIFDNWDEGGADGGATNTKYINAMQAYAQYNENTNPPRFRNGTHYYTFSAGSGDFFVLDTRQFRSPSDEADGPSHTMLGVTQLQDLKTWLLASPAPYKFLATSSPMALHTKSVDCWFGYKRERDELLDHIVANNITGVTFLSGDRHWAGIFELRPGIFEFSVSPIDAFFDELAPSAMEPSLAPERIAFTADFQNMAGLLTYGPSGVNMKIFKTFPQSSNGDPIYNQNFALTNGRMREV
jgi:alkaline phosphatase D